MSCQNEIQQDLLFIDRRAGQLSLLKPTGRSGFEREHFLGVSKVAGGMYIPVA